MTIVSKIHFIGKVWKISELGFFLFIRGNRKTTFSYEIRSG